MIEVKITEVTLGPLKLKCIWHGVVADVESADYIVDNYISSLYDADGIDLKRRYERMRKLCKARNVTPYFLSHPEKGKIIRHVIERKEILY